MPIAISAQFSIAIANYSWRLCRAQSSGKER